MMLTEVAAKEAAHRTRVALEMAEDREITCETCAINDSCEFAFDPYNTDGQCLAEK